MGGERDRRGLSSLGKHFNEGVDKELEKVKKNHPNLIILRPDISSMILEVVEHPEYYGFTNATGTASKTFSGAVANIFRWGAGSGRDRIAAFEPEDGKEGAGGLDKKHLWNKGSHVGHDHVLLWELVKVPETGAELLPAQMHAEGVFCVSGPFSGL